MGAGVARIHASDSKIEVYLGAIYFVPVLLRQ